MLGIEKVDHIGIRVSDKAVSIAFSERLGFRTPAPGNDRPPNLAARLRYAPPVTQLGREAVNALTFELDQSPGAGHSRPSNRPQAGQIGRLKLSDPKGPLHHGLFP